MPELVPRVVLDMVARGETRRRWHTLALFVDVSGFTAMTERLAALGAEGAELLAAALRDYFDPMLALVQRASGQVTGFAGDAFTALFPDDGGGASVEAALQASAGIRDFFAQNPVRRTPYGDFAFGIKLGLCADEVSCEVRRGSSGRFVWYFRGDAIDRAAASEHQAARGQVVLAPEVARRAPGWPAGEAAPAGQGGADRREFPDGVPSAGLRGEALFLPKSALGFPQEGEFRDVVSVFFSFDERCDPAALAPLIADELLRFGDGALRVEFGDKGGVAWTFFGAPVTFEDQTDRALFFARSVLAKAGRGVRAGLTRGGVYAGFLGGRARAEFTCLGRSVNLAARLMASAREGEVWCPQAVRERSRLHEFEPRGALTLKGFSAPIEAFAAAARGAAAPPEEAPLVGRDAEQLRLDALVGGALAAGSPRVVYLDGDAGVGKTALLSALRGRLLARPDAPLVLWGSCSALKGRPFEALREALWGERDVLGDRPGDDIVGALSLLASWGPVVLMLDGAQQIDAASVGALRALLALPSGSLAVVLAARLDDRGGFFRLDLGAPAAALELLPLDDDHLGALLLRELGKPPPPEQLSLISHATGGNPLLARELCASLRAAPAGAPRLLPDEVTPMLVSRLDRLSVNVRRTVQIAAAFGPRLRLESLLSLMSHQPRVFDYVRLAEKARIWGRSRDGFLTFHSGMLRDAAAQMLPRERLRRLLRAACEIEARAGHQAGALAALDQLALLLPEGPERDRVDALRKALRDAGDAGAAGVAGAG